MDQQAAPEPSSPDPSSTRAGDDRAPRDPASVTPRRPWIARALFESLLIVLSVLLALGLDEWRDARAREERAALALRSIRAELVENRASVERARANHLAMRDSLQAYVARGRPPPPELYLGGIFNPALLQATAWESARETGATAEMPYELVLALSRLYGEQQRYRDLAGALVQDIMSQVRREGRELVMRDRSASFIPLQLDFANRESVLLRSYDRVLERLGSIES